MLEKLKDAPPGIDALKAVGTVSKEDYETVVEPIIVITHAQTTEEILAPKRVPAEALQRAEELGAALAQGLAMGIF